MMARFVLQAWFDEAAQALAMARASGEPHLRVAAIEHARRPIARLEAEAADLSLVQIIQLADLRGQLQEAEGAAHVAGDFLRTANWVAASPSVPARRKAH